MNLTKNPNIQIFSAQPGWYIFSNRNLFVAAGEVTMEEDTGVLRCREHLLRLVYNAKEHMNQCPSCGAAAIAQVAEMTF